MDRTRSRPNDSVEGLTYYVSGGGTGTVTLTTDGVSVTAAYGDDESLAGTLHLSTTTPMTATAAQGQTLMAPCMIGGPSKTPEALVVAAASLTVADSTLFLSMAPPWARAPRVRARTWPVA